MPDGDTQGLTGSRAALDASRQQFLRQFQAARLKGTPRRELTEDLAALHRAAEQLLAVLQ